MTRAAGWAGVAALVAFALVLAARPAEPSAPSDRVVAIASGLRCPVCQGLSVADSDSETARNIRADIGRRLDAGERAPQIRQAYVDRYGEWILLRPGRSGFNALVWWLPPLGAAGGAATVIFALWRWRRSTGDSASEEDRRLVEGALGRPLGPR